MTDNDRNRATTWVRAAVLEHQFDATDWEKGFPRIVWHRDADGQYWFGRLLNAGAGPSPVGRYKGWLISEEEKRARFG